MQLDPNKLLAYGIPLSMVIDRVKASTNEVGGRVLDLSGAQYMIRGLGYLHSLNDLAMVAVDSRNGTPVLLRDLGVVSFGGQNVAENIEGRERYPISVRYQRAFRDNIDQMRNVLIATPSGAQIPLGQVAASPFLMVRR